MSALKSVRILVFEGFLGGAPSAGCVAIPSPVTSELIGINYLPYFILNHALNINVAATPIIPAMAAAIPQASTVSPKNTVTLDAV